MTTTAVHDGFATIEEEMDKIAKAMKDQFQPVCRETKETEISTSNAGKRIAKLQTFWKTASVVRGKY